MPDRWRAGLLARILLTVGALLPYWRLLTFSVVLATDDYFTSDIFNGELPGRILVAEGLRAGRLPLWTNAMCSGYPLAGAPADPIGLALFTLLPPAPALDALLIVILLVAAHGTYSLARRFGVDRTAAVLAGLAFSGSGYIATQIKHLSIMSTIIWLPVGLVLIDRLVTAERRTRALLLAGLGLLYANQVLAGFPQSAYICALVYGSFALFRVVQERERFAAVREWLPLSTGFAAALALGAATGAIVLLPLAELTAYTDRVVPLDYRWATYTNFWPRNFFTFFIPYINGDASNGTYIGPPPFWENYGYVGLATMLLAIYGAVRERRRAVVAFFILTTILSFAFILGPRTPIYYVAFQLVPGMGRFRAPTRFMVVVELGLVLLAAVGLTRLRADLQKRWSTSRAPAMIAAAICVATALDLFVHQPRQNSIVPAGEWLAPPRTADIVRRDTPAPRTFSPHHRDVHREVHEVNHGWTNIEPYYTLRDLLAPDTGVYWNVPAADCYVGLIPRWYVMVWSYHYYENSFISEAAFEDFDRGQLTMKPGFTNFMRTYGVTHLLSALPGSTPGLTLIATEPNAYVYRVERSARARVVRAARLMPSEAHVVARLRDIAFDPDREILLLDAPPTLGPTVDGPAGDPWPAATRATITRDDPGEVVIDAAAPEDGFLLLADLFFPGWTATVDGVATPIYRANVSVRGIALPKGRHTVRFTYDSAPFARGVRITAAALGALLLWFGVAAYGAWR
jgi:hypothetical protein